MYTDLHPHNAAVRPIRSAHMYLECILAGAAHLLLNCETSMFISSRSRQGPHCQAARANWKDLGRRFKRKLLEHFHFYKITHQFLFLLPLELLRSQKSNTKRIHIPLSVLRESSQGGDRACPCARFLRHQPVGPPGTCHQPGA